MKLSNTQIEEIKRYLDSLKLNFQEFYDEMLDHLILELETRLEISSMTFDEEFQQLVIELNDAHSHFDWYTGSGRIEGIQYLERKSYQAKNKDVILEYFKQVLYNFSNPLYFLPFLLSLFMAFRFDFMIKSDLDFGFILGLLGGIAFSFFLQILFPVPVADMYFKRGLTKLFVSPASITKMKSIRAHAMVKCIMFSVGLLTGELVLFFKSKDFSLFFLVMGMSLAIHAIATAIHMFIHENENLEIA